jgi:hypothetical protein
MHPRVILFTIVLAACGSNGPVISGSSAQDPAPFVTPDAIKAACSQPTPSYDICFAGVDYAHFPPGSIFKVQPDGSVATLFQRAADSLSSYAQAPDGTVYFTNWVNGTAVYRIDGAGEAVVYQHSTYVRMVRVDSKGQVYFNESSGAGGNGKIYKLVNGVAQLFYEVDLRAVNGFWGDFGFDAQDRLWLSSSNRIPSDFYLVVDSVPQKVYFQPDSSFMGFRFIGKTHVLFAGQDETLRLLDLCSGDVTNVYTVPGTLQAEDVNACPNL